jgi:hypothetical protein
MLRVFHIFLLGLAVEKYFTSGAPGHVFRLAEIDIPMDKYIKKMIRQYQQIILI